jgi:transcriptional regulator with XRE-family HTH domain
MVLANDRGQLMSAEFDDTTPLRQHLITRRLRQRRSDLGLTQKQVVERLARHGLRTTNRTLSSVEHGAGLDVAKLPALAAALDCTVTYLVGLTDDPNRWEPDQAHDVIARRGSAAAPEPAVRSLILGVDIPDRGARLSRLGGDSTKS